MYVYSDAKNDETLFKRRFTTSARNSNYVNVVPDGTSKGYYRFESDVVHDSIGIKSKKDIKNENNDLKQDYNNKPYKGFTNYDNYNLFKPIVKKMEEKYGDSMKSTSHSGVMRPYGQHEVLGTREGINEIRQYLLHDKDQALAESTNYSVPHPTPSNVEKVVTTKKALPPVDKVDFSLERKIEREKAASINTQVSTGNPSGLDGKVTFSESIIDPTVKDRKILIHGGTNVSSMQKLPPIVSIKSPPPPSSISYNSSGNKPELFESRKISMQNAFKIDPHDVQNKDAHVHVSRHEHLQGADAFGKQELKKQPAKQQNTIVYPKDNPKDNRKVTLQSNIQQIHIEGNEPRQQQSSFDYNQQIIFNHSEISKPSSFATGIKKQDGTKIKFFNQLTEEEDKYTPSFKKVHEDIEKRAQQILVSENEKTQEEVTAISKVSKKQLNFEFRPEITASQSRIQSGIQSRMPSPRNNESSFMFAPHPLHPSQQTPTQPPAPKVSQITSAPRPAPQITPTQPLATKVPKLTPTLKSTDKAHKVPKLTPAPQPAPQITPTPKSTDKAPKVPKLTPTPKSTDKAHKTKKNKK
jgi:hypothetical protein